MKKTIVDLTGASVIEVYNIRNTEFVKFDNGMKLSLTKENGEISEVGFIKDYASKNCNKNVFTFEVKNDTQKVINTLSKYIKLWGLEKAEEVPTESTETIKVNNVCYDLDYISSDKLDFSKIEENQIRDLMIDGFELDYLLTLNDSQLDDLFCQYN